MASPLTLARNLIRYRDPGALPDQLVLFVTYVCNLTCQTCFYWESLNSRRRELTVDEYARIAGSLERVSLLLISGGEPLLRPDLPEVIAVFYANNGTRRVHLPTNALQTDVTVRTLIRLHEACPEIEVTLGLSMDGLEATHDRIRGKRGSFRAVVNTSRAVAELKHRFPRLRTYVIMTVCQDNYHEVEPLARFAMQEMPVDDFGFAPVRGRPKVAALHAPSPDEWRDLCARLEPVARHYARQRFGAGLRARMLLARGRYTHDVFTMVLEENRLPFQCRAGQVIGVIEPNGEVRCCELTDVVGSLKEVDFDFRRVWFSARAEAMRRQIIGCSCTHACFIGASLTQYPAELLKAYGAVATGVPKGR